LKNTPDVNIFTTGDIHDLIKNATRGYPMKIVLVACAFLIVVSAAGAALPAEP